MRHETIPVQQLKSLRNEPSWKSLANTLLIHGQDSAVFEYQFFEWIQTTLVVRQRKMAGTLFMEEPAKALLPLMDL